MGYQHGAQAGSLIERYLLLIERIGLSRDELCRNAMTYLPHVKALSPPLVEEVRGLADGADISFEEAFLCQTRFYAARGIFTGEEGCTAFAVKGQATVDGQPLAGQNQDLRVEFADVGIVLRVKPTDGRPRAVMFTFAGQLGYHGMNQYGVSNFTNGVQDFEWQPGLPHYPLKRVMMEKQSTDECVALLRNERACGAANIVLCDSQGDFASVEVRPDRVVVFVDDHQDRLVHTNHYLSEEFASHDKPQPNSYQRLARMRALIQEHWGCIDVETLKGFLSDHEGDPTGICRHGGPTESHSIAGYIAEPAKGLLHIRRGHGCLGSWQTYEV
jgi:hypothetical protein